MRLAAKRLRKPESKLHRALANPPPEKAPGIPPYRRNRPSKRVRARTV
jgi:hypothetical protein